MHTGLRALRLLEERSICFPGSPTSVEKLAPDSADSLPMSGSPAACKSTLLSPNQAAHMCTLQGLPREGLCWNPMIRLLIHEQRKTSR